MGASQNFTINPSVYSKLPYDPRVGFYPVTMVAAIPNILVASPFSPTPSVKDVINRAKANPGKLNFASMGVGSESYLLVAQFATLTGTTIRHVPYGSSGSALAGLANGQVDFAFNALPSVLPSIKSGKIKALAVAGPERTAALPDVPTMAEAGIAGYDAGAWVGLFAPAGTPQQLVHKIQSDAMSTLKERGLANLFVNQGIDPVGNSSDQFAAVIAKDAAKWESVMKALRLERMK
jgi:tripartite-type tricarboxylate transporter receptor subunit TctC